MIIVKNKNDRDFFIIKTNHFRGILKRKYNDIFKFQC